MSHSYLVDVLIILTAAMVCVPLFERLRFGPVLGYLVAGFAIGPGAASAVANVEAIRGLADLGVVFMLFTIGLEFTPERLRLVSRRVYILGIAQVVVTAVVAAAIARLLGGNWPEAVIIGGGLALSSTALVIPVLADLGALNSTAGRTVVAILLLQDLAVGPLLVLVETLSGGGGPLVLSLGLAIGKAAMAIAAILMVGRLILRPLFRLVASARSPELFVGMALLIALGTSWGTEQVGLSMAFGGFLAGMLLGETEYRHQVAADVEPFRGLLLGLFFMTVGMIVDVGTVVREISAITLLALALMAGKTLIVLGLGLVLAMPGGRALRIGAILSQGGEFAFILFGAAAVAGLMPWSEAALLSAMVALTMLVTPVAARAARGITAHLRQRGRMPSAEHIGETLEVRNHVIIVGFGEIGRIVARMLRAYEVPYLILELNGDRIREARGMDEPVYYGNATRAEVLRGVKAGDALAVVVTTDAAGVAEGLAALRRHTFPDLNILVRGGGELSIIALRRAGLTPVGQEATDTGLKLTGAILDLWHAASPQSAD